MTRNLSTCVQAGLDERCPMRYRVEGSDLANVVLGGADHTVELLLNAAGMRRLAEVSARAVADMDESFEREDAARSRAGS